MTTTRKVYHVVQIRSNPGQSDAWAIYYCDRNGEPFGAMRTKKFASEDAARAWAASVAPEAA